MAYFANLDDNNVVLRVICIPEESCENENGVEQDDIGCAYCKSLHKDENGDPIRNQAGLPLDPTGLWVRTSYNAKIRKIFAGPGCTYNSADDAFEPPKPHKSFLLDKTTYTWKPKVDLPADATENGGSVDYIWDNEDEVWRSIPKGHDAEPWSTE